MSGRVVVDGEPVLGIMPPFDSLPDEDIAAVLSYLAGLDHAPVLFTADEVKAARAQPKLAPTEMAAVFRGVCGWSKSCVPVQR